MTKQQMQWASGHDWFISASDTGHVIVQDWNEAGEAIPVTFQDYQELRVWAGY